MSKAISMVTAISGFYLFPNLLATDLAERHTIGFTVYVVYIVAILSFAYYVRKHTQDEIKTAYKRAKKTDSIARFDERMKQL